MKELDDFKVERLEEIAARAEYFAKNINPIYPISAVDVCSLAKIALVVKTAEPVANLIQDESCFSGMVGHIHVELITKSGDVKNNGTVAPLYAVPVLNSPELPDGWIPCNERMPADGDLVLVWDGKYRYTCFRMVGFWQSRIDETTITHWMELPAPPTMEK